MKLSVCIDMMYADLDFSEKIDRVKTCGIDTVEFWKWSDKNIEETAEKIRQNKMHVSIFNLDSTDKTLSYDLSRGILNAGRRDDFLLALKESLPIYRQLNADAMIVLIGENAEYNEENVKSCLTAAIPFLDENDVTLVVEPLNSYDRVGYSMPYATPVIDLLRKINNPHIKMLYDIYHQNQMGDFSLEEIQNNIDLIGHFHIADVPGRHEPGTGTVDYAEILKKIEKLPYNGYMGLEYRPTVSEEETFSWFKEREEC